MDTDLAERTKRFKNHMTYLFSEKLISNEDFYTFVCKIDDLSIDKKEEVLTHFYSGIKNTMAELTILTMDTVIFCDTKETEE